MSPVRGRIKNIWEWEDNKKRHCCGSALHSFQCGSRSKNFFSVRGRIKNIWEWEDNKKRRCCGSALQINADPDPRILWPKIVNFTVWKLQYIFIPRPPWRASKLQEKPPALKKEHLTIRNNTFLHIFFCWSFLPILIRIWLKSMQTWIRKHNSGKRINRNSKRKRRSTLSSSKPYHLMKSVLTHKYQ